MGWESLDYVKALLIDIYASNPLTLNTTVFGTIGIAAIIFAAVLGTLLVQDLIRRVGAKKEAHAAARQQFETFLGGDELLKELERVDAACARLSGSLEASGQDVHTRIIELSHLRFALVGLGGKYTRIWPLTLDNKVTMVADQLGEASSALSEGNLEHTKAHIDGAVQNARAFITELKGPPLVNNEKNVV